MEDVILGIIWPSAEVKRTLLLGIHDIYWIWDQLRELASGHLPDGHIEQPFFHAWRLEGRRHMFYCPSTSVDNQGFPNSDEEMGRAASTAPTQIAFLL